VTFNRLSEGQLDALKEVSNIGMGHAATALSQLIGETIYLRVPRVTVTDIAQVPELIGGAEREVVGITLRVLGDARGNILLVFPRESAQRLLARLLRQEETAAVLDELGISTLKEVGNILASAYLNALGSLLHMTLIPSVPMLAWDMAGAVIDYVLIELSQAGDLAMMVETEFHGVTSGTEGIKGHFFLLPDPASLGFILDAVGGAP
jgi:chemotaxis protein CheC